MTEERDGSRVNNGSVADLPPTAAMQTCCSKARHVYYHRAINHINRLLQTRGQPYAPEVERKVFEHAIEKAHLSASSARQRFYAHPLQSGVFLLVCLFTISIKHTH